MNKESITTPDSVHEELDLYDGMIAAAMTDRRYFDKLNPDILKEIHGRLKYYIDKSDYDIPSKKFGLGEGYLDIVMMSMKDRVEQLMNEVDLESEEGVDFHDALIVEALKNPDALNHLDKDDLKIIRSRLEQYYEILGDGRRGEEAVDLENRFGFYLNMTKLNILIGLCDSLLYDERKG